MKEATQKAKWELERAVTEAAKVIAEEAQSAKKVIADAAAEALKVYNTKNADGTNDHDLIIKLDTKMDAMQVSIDKINDGVNTKINDHEMRLRRLELWGALAVGFLYAIQVYLNFFRK